MLFAKNCNHFAKWFNFHCQFYSNFCTEVASFLYNIIPLILIFVNCELFLQKCMFDFTENLISTFQLVKEMLLIWVDIGFVPARQTDIMELIQELGDIEYYPQNIEGRCLLCHFYTVWKILKFTWGLFTQFFLFFRPNEFTLSGKPISPRTSCERRFTEDFPEISY